MPPHIVVIAGPNGAGKSTVAPYLLSQTTSFINADEIAKELTATASRNVDIEAGRLLLQRLEELERQRANIAVETTLANRSLAIRIARLRSQDYRFHLFFVWLPNADLAVERVAERVQHGGHSVPEAVIRRRYAAGLRNFFTLYRPLADGWRLYDNSTGVGPPKLVARGSVYIRNKSLWNSIEEEWNRER